MSKIRAHFADYGRYHRTSGNKLTHLIGIPLIVVSLLGLLDRIELLPWSLPCIHFSPAFLLWAVSSAYYLSLHVKLGFALMISVAGLYLVGVALSSTLLWTLFVLGWVLQLFGHYYYEKKSPAFGDNLLHLIIGPAFILNHVLRWIKV